MVMHLAFRRIGTEHRETVIANRRLLGDISFRSRADGASFLKDGMCIFHVRELIVMANKIFAMRKRRASSSKRPDVWTESFRNCRRRLEQCSGLTIMILRQSIGWSRK